MGELGTRYKCYKCETKFYDLGKPQPICPSCGEDQNNREPRQVLKRRKKRSSLKMEPDIHLLPEDHEALPDHEEPGHEEHEALPDMDDEKENEHDHEEEYPLDKSDRLQEEDADGYGVE